MPTMRKKVAQQIMLHKVLAIVRLKNSAAVQASIDSLVDGGIKVLEITANTPDFCLHVQLARQKYPELIVGAGTILNAELATQAMSAGAQFLVTPNVNIDVIEIAHASNAPVLMGAATPTEIANAIAHGADIIKLFPANALGIAYYQAIKGPFCDAAIFAVGGINSENAGDWMKAGVQGIGVGSEFTKETNDEHEVREQGDLIRLLIEKISLPSC